MSSAKKASRLSANALAFTTAKETVVASEWDAALPIREFLENPAIQCTAHLSPLSPEDYIERVVAIANGNVSLLCWAELFLGVSLSAVRMPIGDLLVVCGNAVPSVPKCLTGRLLRIVDEGSDAQIEMRKKLIEEMSGKIVSIHKLSKAGLHDRRMLFSDAVAAVAFGIWQLLVPPRPLTCVLCYCHLEGCRIFFVQDRNGKTGRDSVNYCSDAHKLEGQRALQRKRLEKYRGKRKNKKKLSTYRRG